MKSYEDIPLKISRLFVAWYHFPFYHELPQGTLYRTSRDPQFRTVTAKSETLAFDGIGEWLEIVDEAENTRIRYLVF